MYVSTSHILIMKAHHITATNKEDIVALIVQLLVMPQFTLAVARTFRPILQYLMMKVPNVVLFGSQSHESTSFLILLKNVSISFSLLLPLCPQSLRYLISDK